MQHVQLDQMYQALEQREYHRPEEYEELFHTAEPEYTDSEQIFSISFSTPQQQVGLK